MKLSIDHVMEFDHDVVGASNTWHRDSSSKRAYYERMNRDFNVNDSREKKMAMRRANARAYYANRITPDTITQLAEGEIFVFGSNVDGTHNGGAAAAAVQNFGAIIGQARDAATPSPPRAPIRVWLLPCSASLTMPLSIPTSASWSPASAAAMQVTMPMTSPACSLPPSRLRTSASPRSSGKSSV